MAPSGRGGAARAGHAPGAGRQVQAAEARGGGAGGRAGGPRRRAEDPAGVAGSYQGMQLSAARRRKGERKGLGLGGLVPPPVATAMVWSSITQPYSLLSVKKAGTRRD